METTKNYQKVLTYLFQPEDSSAGAGVTPVPGPGGVAGFPGWLGQLKVALWAMIAVGMPIGLALLLQ